MKIYIATPYTHDDIDVMQKRFEGVSRKAGELMLKGHIVFSPISHSHPIALELLNSGNDVVCDLAFWQKQDMPFIEWCDELYIMDVEGWNKSAGVQAEIKEARRLDKPITFVRGYDT